MSNIIQEQSQKAKDKSEETEGQSTEGLGRNVEGLTDVENCLEGLVQEIAENTQRVIAITQTLVDEIGKSTSQAAEDIGQFSGQATEEAGEKVGQAVQAAGKEAGEKAGKAEKDMESISKNIREITDRPPEDIVGPGTSEKNKSPVKQPDSCECPVESTVYISDLNLKDEWIKISNKRSSPVSLTGWKIEDEDRNHTYIFSSYTLDTGSTVTVYTGKGTNTASELYWGSGRPIWNNKGDTAYLYDENGKLISSMQK